MGRFIAYVGIVIVAGITLCFLPSSSGSFAIVGGIATGFLIPLVDIAATGRRYFRIAWYSLRYRNQRIRVSISYLYRIKLDNVYLLIRGRRFSTYVPVGGVYKVSPGATLALARMNVLNDDLVPLDAMSTGDLRVRIPGKNLMGFVRWFESGDSRETAPWREFWEELVSPGVLPASAFPWVLHDYVRRYFSKIRYSSYAQSMELFIADVYELLPTPYQKLALEKLKHEGHPDIVWATQDQVLRRGVVPGVSQQVHIGDPAEWIL